MHVYQANSSGFESTDFASVMIDDVGCSRRHQCTQCALWGISVSLCIKHQHKIWKSPEPERKQINIQKLKLTYVLFRRVFSCPVPPRPRYRNCVLGTDYVACNERAGELAADGWCCLSLNVIRWISALDAITSRVLSAFQAFPVLKYKIITAKQYNLHLQAQCVQHWFCTRGVKNPCQQQFGQWLVTNSEPVLPHCSLDPFEQTG